VLHEWTEGITGNKFLQFQVESVENDYNIELIPKMRIQIVKDYFNPIFNGFGILEEDLVEFYKSLELKLKERDSN